MKIRPAGAELSHADGRTNTGKHDETVTFRNFAKAPINKPLGLFNDAL
jgi:hypothetical protein